jgi:hypothetical protein
MDIDIELLPKQQQILQDPHRFKVLDCGRRFGKTEYCAIEHVIKALAGKPDSVQWMIAPTYSTSKIMWRKLKEIIRKCGLSDYVSEIKEGELYIRFINGTTIWCKSADNPENLVGEGLSHVSLDEFGIMKPDVWYESIRPALLDKGGSATFIGTPNGKNHFYDLFCKEDPNWVSYKYTSYDNPLIDSRELEDIVRDMPEFLFRQEIMAEFLDEGGDVFRQYVRMVCELDKPNYEESVIFGIDLGKLNDFTVIVGYSQNTWRPIYFDRFNKIDWEYQINRIVEVCSKFPNSIIYIDSSGVGEPLYDSLKKENLLVRAVTLSAGKKINTVIQGTVKHTVPKQILIQRLAVDIEIGKFYLPKDKHCVEEFGQYAYNITPSGNVTYSAPVGKHDDCVMACALACFGLEMNNTAIGGITGDLEFTPTDDNTKLYGDDISEYDYDVFDWNEEY